MKIVLIALAAALVFAPHAARADDPIGVGLYAPSAPFAGTAERLGFITALADHLSAKLGRPVSGRVYASLGALDAALKKGEVTHAILDAPNLAMRGGKPLLTLTRGGSSSVGWVVAGGSARDLGALAGKRLAVAQVGGREGGFVTGVLFEGEVEAAHFGSIVDAPDAQSAAKLVALGKADAALVPAETGGVLGTALALRSLPWPALIAGPRADAATTEAVVAAARTWSGSGPFTGFGAPIGVPGAGRAKKRPIMATTPARRLDMAPVLGDRSYPAPRADIRRYVSAK